MQNAANVRAGAAVGELAVAERAGPALAKEIIALRIVRAALVEGADVVDAVAHRPAALQHQRSIALLRQKPGGGQTARPRADHDGPMRQRLVAGRRQDEGLLGIAIDANAGGSGASGQRGQALLVVGDGDLGGVDELQRILVARVEALAEDAPGWQGRQGDAEQPSQTHRQLGFGSVQGQVQIGNTQRHVIIL